MNEGGIVATCIFIGCTVGFIVGVIVSGNQARSNERLRIHTAICQQQGGILQQDDTCLVGGHVGEKLP